MLKSNELSSRKQTRRKRQCALLREAPLQSLRGIPPVALSGRYKTRDTVTRPVIAEVEAGGTGRAQRILRAVKPLCVTLCAEDT